MEFPKDYKYTQDHEWIYCEKDGMAYVGITSYAIEHLGDIVHIEFPEVGDELEMNASFGTIESTKTVSDCFMPVTGKIIEINDDLLSDLNVIAEDPYNEGWLIKIEIKNKEELEKLMSAEEYQTFLNEVE